MTDATTVVLSKLAAMLELDADTILTQSVQGFVNDTITQTQKKISELYIEHQRFQQKYGMSLEAFMRDLDALEEDAEENATIQGVPWLEAVSDSRWWAHVQDDLAAETTKLEQLQTLQNYVELSLSREIE
jgi:hypothetical protein